MAEPTKVLLFKGEDPVEPLAIDEEDWPVFGVDCCERYNIKFECGDDEEVRWHLFTPSPSERTWAPRGLFMASFPAATLLKSRTEGGTFHIEVAFHNPFYTPTISHLYIYSPCPQMAALKFIVLKSAKSRVCR
jgi:hypothetical protein